MVAVGWQGAESTWWGLPRKESNTEKEAPPLLQTDIYNLACVYVYIYACMYLCMYVYIYIYIDR